MPNPRNRWLAAPLAALVALVALVAVGLTVPAASASTPRAQFYTGYSMTGDKLDKDARGEERYLFDTGRQCIPGYCWTFWDDVISSLDTTGGGQEGAWLRIYDLAEFAGACALIPPGVKLFDLRSFTLGRDGTNWDKQISSIEVFVNRPPDKAGCAAADNLAPTTTRGVISNPASSAVLDVSGKSPTRGAAVQTWSYLGGGNQVWAMAPALEDRSQFNIRPQHHGGACLGVVLGSGLAVQTDECWAATSQWRFWLAYQDSFGVDVFRLRSDAANGCLEMTPGTNPVGARVRITTCAHNLNQLWRTGSVAGHLATNTVLDVPGFDARDGAALQTWPFIGERNQDWKAEPRINGAPPREWRLTVRHTGMCLDVVTLERGAAAVQRRCDPTRRSQSWSGEQVSVHEGLPVYRLHNMADPRFCLDQAGGQNPRGARVQIWDCNDLTNQRWLV
ncbi:ricin-type beta-trefoil lectin protein [Krasilnikovia cinnamomea]|uniref:Ricin-type beta-trefoil lectin protein n=1 Tax=Krasilnikovia cinnamomea TaxID=349313 RepID=A0A4V2G7P2_9ACTN|nr:RICIN domain-containing protein [Krasilnikovia cinnamomea]RZU53296.1 ricin-type beta-trefoil lectin protein [Krasilnikovia cinnamomea]